MVLKIQLFNKKILKIYFIKQKVNQLKQKMKSNQI